jgi:DnaJ like chaperone protein
VLGKILGGCFGFLFAGTNGLFLGILLGYFFDKGLNVQWWLETFSSQLAFHNQQILFDTTFLIMGYIAKRDGRVSENEIQAAQSIMNRMSLNPTQRMLAVSLFNQGKQATFEPYQTLDGLIEASKTHPELVRLFVEIQIQVLLTSGQLSQAKIEALQQICQYLKAPLFNISYFEQFFQQNQGGKQWAHQSQPTKLELKKAYTLLEINEHVSHEDVKKAYRRMMSKYHPDKAIAKGSSQRSIKQTTEKAQAVKEAYNRICQARGI